MILLEGGREFFPSLAQAIESSQADVFLQTYILADDAIGKQIMAALTQAARRGVAVHLLADAFGTGALPSTFSSPLLASGGKTLFWRTGGFLPRRKHLERLHRKLAVVDGRLAFIGGINLKDDLAPGFAPYPRLDYALRIEGPLVHDAFLLARDTWNLMAKRVQKPWLCFPVLENRAQPKGDTPAALIARTKASDRNIENTYLELISLAKKEILIANAFFLPTKAFCQALFDAARRGVRVILLLQGKIEYFWIYYATQALYTWFGRQGVEVYEFLPAYLHAKVAVVDTRFFTLGSSNLDPLSLFHGLEANVVAEDPVLAAQLRQGLFLALAQGGVAGQARLGHLGQRLFARASHGLLAMLGHLSRQKGKEE